MANNFRGYLLKSGSDVFPHKYINCESYQSTPDQREEIQAYRDDNTRKLYRITAGSVVSGVVKGCKTSIKFNTMPGLSLDEKIEIVSWFSNHYAGETGDTAEQVKLQRKLPLTVWNDELHKYVTGYYYLTDITWTIESITNNNIYYNEATIELVEY